MNILIVEDERVSARRLERLTKEILNERVTSIICVETLYDSKKYIKNHQIDVLILDLNLHGQDGFTILKDVVSESFQTIIVSANTDRAIEAYNYGVIDFVPKPFEKTRLLKAFERLEGGTNFAAKVLVVRNQGQIQIIQIDRIKYLRGAGDYAELHLHNGSVILHNKSLEALNKILPPSFLRIHKSYIADLHRIENVNIYGGGKYKCIFKDGTILPVSRTRYKDLISYLETGK